MSRVRRAVLGTAVALLAAAVVSVPAASAADVVLPFSNYKVGGSLTVKKLNQSIALPPGSTFNGWANITQQTLIGNVFVPEFTSTIKVLGVPTQVTTKLEQVQPVQGSVTVDSNFNVHIRSTNTALLRIKKLRLEPLVLALNYDGPLVYPLAFDGTTTIPRLTGCGLLGPTLGTLLSGPGNAYHITLAPPS
jgi:hypothetical protein